MRYHNYIMTRNFKESLCRDKTPLKSIAGVIMRIADESA